MERESASTAASMCAHLPRAASERKKRSAVA
jgi:hypothetical protein